MMVPNIVMTPSERQSIEGALLQPSHADHEHKGSSGDTPRRYHDTPPAEGMKRGQGMKYKTPLQICHRPSSPIRSIQGGRFCGAFQSMEIQRAMRRNARVPLAPLHELDERRGVLEGRPP